jgi:hypothetical protein
LFANNDLTALTADDTDNAKKSNTNTNTTNTTTGTMKLCCDKT